MAQAIQIVASEETYQNLTSFTDVKQLNETIRAYKDLHKDQLTKSALNILNLLHVYSAKYPGVSFLCKNSIAAKLSISRRTVIRACQLLEDLGIIKQYEMKRKSDRLQTSNAIVIQPLEVVKEENVTQEQGKMSHQENNTFLKQIHNINHLNVNDSNKNGRKAYIKGVPKKLQHYQAFFGKRVKELYGRVWLAAKKLGLSVEQDVMQSIGFMVMEQLKGYVKNGQLTEEEQCKYAYKVAYKQLTQRVDRGEILDFTGLFAIAERIQIKKPVINREELDLLGVY